MRNSGYHPYESQPTFDDQFSPDSSDSPPTHQPFANQSPPQPIYTNQSPSPPPLYQSSIHSSDIMPSYTDNHKSDNKISSLSNNTAKTTKKPISLSSIIKNGPTDFTNRINIFENVACGNCVFDIGFYVRHCESYLSSDNNSDDSPNTLCISISHKSRSRGTKRKASQSNDNLPNKKRKMNNSNAQSYTINGTNGHSFNTNDNNYTNDNIKIAFTIHIAANSNDTNPIVKRYECKFGESNDSDSELNSSTWDNDADNDSNINISNMNGFKAVSFDDLADKISNCIDTTSDNKKPNILIWCTIEILNISCSTLSDNELNGSNFSNRNRTLRRHLFHERKVYKFVGLKNEGATCYMNSMLQTLYHIASLRRNVYKIPVGHEAQQKKKKEQDLKKEAEKNGTVNTNAMDVCDDDETCTNMSDDEDMKPKRNIKPPLSLELQRLFYQLQTGAESNHQDEYQLGHKQKTNKKKSKKKNKKKSKQNDMESSDGNDSDCSIFTLKSDEEYTGDKTRKDKSDDDVDMTQTLMDSDNDSIDMKYWSSSYDKAVSTSNLIKSFGWSGSDAFVQHDVQEFLRVLMDKIEAKVKGTPAEKIVERLFTGEYQSYVSCKNVDYESVRNENFQDIQLTIPKSGRRNKYGSSSSLYSSNSSRAPDIYDCINKFIEPETLDGDNQYYANDEHKKQDADKGLRFKRFPPVLFLQLCRFEIDHYQHTSKINDPVRFYEDIDLNPFVYVEPKKKGEEKKEDVHEAVEYNKQAPNRYYNHLPVDYNGNGEFSYQLFSVLVHSGSTYGGHYFAYINPSGNKWYKFDDENVCVVSKQEATEKQFGGSSRQSAYMLVYIQKKYAKQILGEVDEGHIPFDLRKYFSAEKEKQRKMRLEEIENSKKCMVSYMNGHDMIYEDVDIKNECDECYVNVLDMGMRTLLKTDNVYKDMQFKDLYKRWSNECGIAMENLMIYNFTERKNKTLRTNREIKLDLKEDDSNDDTHKYDKDDIKRHKIETKEELKYVKSMYNRMGNVQGKKRMFVLFDKTKVEYLEKKGGNDGKIILMALKYFDIFEQKLYFVDWVLVKTGNITFGDVMKYVEQKLTKETKDKRTYFNVLYNYCNDMNEWERKTGKKEERFIICEEECVLKNKGTREDPKCKVSDELGLNVAISEEYFHGDLFVFQLNAYHPFFNTLKLDSNSKKIDNIKEIVNKNNSNNGTGNKPLALKFKLIKYEFEEKGSYWYSHLSEFINSQLSMTCVEIKVRENTGWKTRWTAALAMQYKNNNNIPISQDIDKEIKKKLFKSKHKWYVEKRITYGMIRKKLGYYYNINPNHIEIWLPRCTYSYEKWDYGSNGRGKWNGKLEKLISDGRSDWNEQCSLKFEIQTYSVKDFDQMTRYNDSNSSYMMHHSNVKFSQRIKELAMFNLEIIAPNKAQSGCGNMTMSFCKNWTGKTLANGILKEVIENPIFGYTFFSEIVKYIRENEIDSDEYMDDISILKSLSANRFLICDENDSKLPSQYYMNKQYKMPDHFSQVKYTDFRVQFLAKNDPLVLGKNKSNENENENENENKIDIDDNDNDNDNEMDIDMERDREEKDNTNTNQNTNALWFYIYKNTSYSSRKIYKIRVVIENGQSLKDVILKYLKPYLKIDYKSLENSSKQSSLSIDVKDDKSGNDSSENESDNSKGKSNDERIFDQIVESHKFKLQGTNTTIKKGHLVNAEIIKQIDCNKMYMKITCPMTKKKSMNSYDKPLKIAD